MDDSIQKMYSNKLRVRACGICIKQDKILLVNLNGITEGEFWSPPGGGVEFGERAVDCIVREFKEETHLDVEVGDFLFACEFITNPLHAIELFFEVRVKNGVLQTGTDPEFRAGQPIKSAAFMNWDKLDQLKPENLHGIFRFLNKKCEISHLRGYFKL
jgi:8-oxo-dGTP diphosphatase